MAGDNTIAAAALAVALVALLSTLGQVLQQYFGTAEGYRRCQGSVLGPWASRTRLRFRWSEFRFETLFTVPHIMLHRTVWASSEMPNCPYADGEWILGRPVHQKGALEVNLLLSGRAADAPELVTWLRFLRSIQWTHKRMLFKLSRVTQMESEKNDLRLAEHENRNLTIPLVRFEERSWDFMPPDVVKPFARINIGDLGVLARRLGMEWDRFEPSDGILRAQGNGYTLTSVLVRSVGTMVEINEISGSGAQNAPLPWSTPMIPEQVERKLLICPNAAADKMAFGILPCVGSDFVHRDFDVSSLEVIPELLRHFGLDETLIAAFRSGQWQKGGWCPGVCDLLSIMAPMIYRPELSISEVPAPDNGLLFHGATAAYPALGQFRICLRNLIESTDASQMSYIVWVHDKISSLASPSDAFTFGDEFPAHSPALSSRQSGSVPSLREAYDAYRAATALIFDLTKKGNPGQVPPRRPSYSSLITYHLQHMFDHQKISTPDHAGPEQDLHYIHPTFPYPSPLNVEWVLWAQRMKVYFQRLPGLVSEMEEAGWGNREQIMSGWVLMIFRGMCWSRCHVLVSGKTIPIQYCGSQLPVYLG